MNPRTLPLLLLALFAASASAHEYRFFREDVLGTSMELCVNADSREHADAAERTVLAHIKHLRSILSSYESNSEFSRFATAPVGQSVTLSPELFQVLQACDEWNHASRGAFNPGVAQLTQLWQQASENNILPSARALRSTTQVMQQAHWELNSSDGTATRKSTCRLSLNAIAKGYILDQVASRIVKDANGVTGAMLNVGGDICVRGSIVSTVDIANPRNDTIGAAPLAQVRITQGAIATSGQSERHFLIGGTKHSHIIDPRSGMPVRETVSVSVIAPNATMADALATICGVLSTSDSLALVNSIPQAECLLVSAAGLIVRSTNWPQEKKQTDKKQTDKKKSEQNAKPTGHEMLVEFEIAKPRNSRRYRRPYVAVWIEDKDTFPVKTLSLFLMQNNPGPRWYRDIRRCYSDDRMRKLVDPKDMIKTVSKPTRNPGKYKVTWDGRDDNGKLVKPGTYTLLIEAAREHGSYQLIKQQFEFGKAMKQKLKGNAEISTAGVTYVVKDAAKANKEKR